MSRRFLCFRIGSVVCSWFVVIILLVCCCRQSFISEYVCLPFGCYAAFYFRRTSYYDHRHKLPYHHYGTKALLVTMIVSISSRTITLAIVMVVVMVMTLWWVWLTTWSVLPLVGECGHQMEQSVHMILITFLLLQQAFVFVIRGFSALPLLATFFHWALCMRCWWASVTGMFWTSLNCCLGPRSTRSS